MARKPVADPSKLFGSNNAAAQSVEAFAGIDKPRKGTSGKKGKAAIRKLVDEVRAMVKADRYSMMTPTQLVALYYLCHSEVYGAEPSELAGEMWRQACMAAGRLIKTEFGGNSIQVVEYIRWTWSRERWREERRDESATRWRITWRQQFVQKTLISDYRTEMARRARKAKGMKSRSGFGRRWNRRVEG